MSPNGTTASDKPNAAIGASPAADEYAAGSTAAGDDGCGYGPNCGDGPASKPNGKSGPVRYEHASHGATTSARPNGAAWELQPYPATTWITRNQCLQPHPNEQYGIQHQPHVQNRGAGGGKFNFPCDNGDQYGHGTNYCPFPHDDIKIANKKAARIARNAEADDRQRRVNQILMDRGFHNAVSILPSEHRAQRYNQANMMNPGFSQGM